MSKSVSKSFDDIVNDQQEIDDRRKRLENNILKVVIILSVIGLGSAAVNFSTTSTIVSWFSPSGGHNVTIFNLTANNGNNLSQISNQSTPTFNNTFVRFNVSFNDGDLGDWHMLYVCNSSNHNYTLDDNGVIFNFTCGGSYQLCNSSNRLMSTDNPLVCDFNVYGWSDQTQNFTAFIIDSGGEVTAAGGIFAVDRPPYIISINVVKL